jgi:hypothetical protein
MKGGKKRPVQTNISYPKDDVSILSTWEDRFEQWKAVADNSFSKRHYCYRDACRVTLDRFSGMGIYPSVPKI